MKGYAGSIATTADGSRIAMTSAPGGVVMVFDGAGAPVACHSRTDLCGVAAWKAGFVVTDGLGAAWSADEAGLELLTQQAVAWDNHLISLR